MKIIKINKKNIYRTEFYQVLDFLLEFGMKYLPFIFLKKVYLSGKQLKLPRWITERRMSQIDKRTQKLMNDLNWE